MFRFVPLFAMLLVLACSDTGVEPMEQKAVPNHSPKNHLEPVPVEEQASTADLLNMQQIREQEAEYRHLAEDAELVEEIDDSNQARFFQAPTLVEEPEFESTDLRAMNPQRQTKTAREYRDTLLNRKSSPPLQPLPPPMLVTNGLNRETRGPADLTRRTNTENKEPATAKKKMQPHHNGGSRLFKPRVRQSAEIHDVGSVIPPGRFFTAQLVGNATVTLFSPVIIAEIFDPDGNPIGTAVGRATLHRYLKDRALIQFGRLHLNDGRTVSGELHAFELDKSMGLMGTVERQSFKRFAFAVAETFLAALSLEVETDGESFGNVFKFQLADRLLDQANSRLRELDLDRQIHLSRDTTFLVAGIRETSLGRQDYSTEIDQISSHAREALNTTIHSANYSDARRRELDSAYNRLSSRLKDLPPQPNR